jgi:hypothetical protein
MKLRARKKDGHEFDGWWLCNFTDSKGRKWMMVELDIPGAEGLMFHFRVEQMELYWRES